MQVDHPDCIEIAHLKDGMGIRTHVRVAGDAIETTDRAVTITLPSGGKVTMTEAEAELFAKCFSIMLYIPFGPMPDGMDGADR